jgi:hypothetical protein
MTNATGFFFWTSEAGQQFEDHARKLTVVKVTLIADSVFLERLVRVCVNQMTCKKKEVNK